MFVRNILPTINNIHSCSVDPLIRTGFAYVRLAPQHARIEKELQSLHQSGLAFFRSGSEYKKQWAFNEKKMEGYADREEGGNPQTIKQFFFRPQNPLGPFKKDVEKIAAIHNVFHDEIALPLLSRIFSEANLAEHYPEISEKTFPSFAFSYYPERIERDGPEPLKAHKDFDMITVLWITKPGLEMFYDKAWHRADPKPGYVAVNLGNTLELMTNKKTTSVLHRVRLLSEERLSFGVFVGPGGPIKDFTSNRVIHASYNAYLSTQFNSLYEEPESAPEDKCLRP